MSFVGTRPEAVKYVDAYKKKYYATLLLPAGITSVCSIKYKDEAELLDGVDDPDRIGLYQTKLKYKKEWFAKPIEIPFEDMMVEAPTEIEKYLSMRYGDYMSLPPKDEQIPKMDPAFVDINTPYIKYKGIKYCKKNNKE